MSFLLVERQDDGVCTISLNRPDRHNALCPLMLDELSSYLQELEGEADVRCVVLRGAGEKAFSSGYDLLTLPTPDTNLALAQEEPVVRVLERVRSYPYPVICMIYGYAMGAGLNLAVAGDLRIAADNAKFAMPPAKLGVVYPPSGLKQFMALIGPAKTKYMFLSARTVSAAKALSFGLIDEVLPEAELAAYTHDIARDIAAKAPMSLSGMKRIINHFADGSELDDEDLAEFDELRVQALGSDDMKEALLAFQERRKPVFRGA